MSPIRRNRSAQRTPWLCYLHIFRCYLYINSLHHPHIIHLPFTHHFSTSTFFTFPLNTPHHLRNVDLDAGCEPTDHSGVPGELTVHPSIHRETTVHPSIHRETTVHQAPVKCQQWMNDLWMSLNSRSEAHDTYINSTQAQILGKKTGRIQPKLQ